MSFKVLTDNFLINVTIFNRAFYKQHLHVGRMINLIGRYERKNKRFREFGDLHSQNQQKGPAMIVCDLSHELEHVPFSSASNAHLLKLENRILQKAKRLCDGLNELCNGNTPISGFHFSKPRAFFRYRDRSRTIVCPLLSILKRNRVLLKMSSFLPIINKLG